MDPKLKTTYLNRLFKDTKFHSLKSARDLVDHLLTNYLFVDDTLRNLIDNAALKLSEWNIKHNGKSAKLAKQNCQAARSLAELKSIDSQYAVMAEQRYTTALECLPFIDCTAQSFEADRVLKLKLTLLLERAKIRLSIDKQVPALKDIEMAFATAKRITLLDDDLAKQLQTMAVKCVAELKLIEPTKVTEVIDSINRRMTSSSPPPPSSSNEPDVTTIDASNDAASSVDDNDEEEKQMDAGGQVQVEVQLDEISNFDDNDNTLLHQQEQLLYQTISRVVSKLCELIGDGSNFGKTATAELKLKNNASQSEDYFRYQIDDRIEIRSSEGKGRHFIAHETIPPGTVILVEKPFSSIVSADFMSSRCNYCMKNLPDRGYPCVYCREAHYCGVKCATDAYHTYHRHECGILGFLVSHGLTITHVFRILSQIGLCKALQYDQQQPPASYSIEDFLAEKALRTKPVQELTDDDMFTLYRMSTSLTEHSEKYSANLNAHHGLEAINMALILMAKHLKTILEGTTEKLEETFARLVKLCLVYFRRVTVNVFGYFEYNNNTSGGGSGSTNSKQTISTIEILVGSLINHSCAPNVDWQAYSGHIRFTTNRAIGPGEEINITYGQSKHNPFAVRQEGLAHYYFVCACKLCREDVRKQSSLVVRCGECDGPVVYAKRNAGCLECCTSANVDQVKQEYDELQHSEKLLRLCHELLPTVSSHPQQHPHDHDRDHRHQLADMVPTSDVVLSTATPTNNNKKSGKKKITFEQAILSLAYKVENILSNIAFTGTAYFLEKLRLLAEVYLRLGQTNRAVELCKIYQECDQDDLPPSSLSSTLDYCLDKNDTELSKMFESKLYQLNFWCEVCAAHFDAARRAGLYAAKNVNNDNDNEDNNEDNDDNKNNTNADEQSSPQQSPKQQQRDQHFEQVAILVHLRFLKLSCFYLERYIGEQTGQMNVNEWLQSHINAATGGGGSSGYNQSNNSNNNKQVRAKIEPKFIYILSEKKKATLNTMMQYVSGGGGKRGGGGTNTATPTTANNKVQELCNG